MSHFLHPIHQVLAVVFLCASAACWAQSVTRYSDAGMLAEAALGGLPGVAAAGTLRAGKIVVAVSRSSGGASAEPKPSAEPLFEIGSVSKVFTGLLLAQAVERGELRLEDTVASLLKSSVTFQSHETESITLGQLVTHTSCLRGLPEDPRIVASEAQITSYDRKALWRALGRTRVAKAPPCESNYSNFGFAVLGELLSQRAGRPWEELVRAQITGPLGMHDTIQTLPKAQEQRLPLAFVREVPARRWDMDAFSGAGGLRSTASDMLIFSKALIDGRTGPLGAAAERLVTALAPYGTKSTSIGYAVMLPTSRSKVWAHNGITGGYLAEWIVWPESREAIVLLVSNLAAPSHPIAQSLIKGP